MKVAFFGISLAVLGLAPSFVYAEAPAPGTDIARGTVFLDANGNGKRDRSEPGISDVSVTNGLDVVQTDHRGEYRISLPPESFLGISKPADYEVPVDRNNLPQILLHTFPERHPGDRQLDGAGDRPDGTASGSHRFSAPAGQQAHERSSG